MCVRESERVRESVRERECDRMRECERERKTSSTRVARNEDLEMDVRVEVPSSSSLLLSLLELSDTKVYEP